MVGYLVMLIPDACMKHREGNPYPGRSSVAGEELAEHLYKWDRDHWGSIGCRGLGEQ